MPGDFRGILDNLISNLTKDAKRAVFEAVPKCNYCGGTSMPLPCIACGEFTCFDHAFINKNIRLMCSPCVEEHDVDLTVDHDEPSVANPDKERLAWAFSVLGLEEGASEDEVKEAFKELALQHHPDRGGSSKAFSDLQDARDVALEHTRREQ